MRIAFSRRALRDLRKIGDFIAADNPRRAGTFIAELRAACESLETASNRYPLIEMQKGYRRMPVSSYLVFYQVRGESVRIMRIVHSALDLRDLSLN